MEDAARSKLQDARSRSVSAMMALRAVSGPGVLAAMENMRVCAVLITEALGDGLIGDDAVAERFGKEKQGA